MIDQGQMKDSSLTVNNNITTDVVAVLLLHCTAGAVFGRLLQGARR